MGAWAAQNSELSTRRQKGEESVDKKKPREPKETRRTSPTRAPQSFELFKGTPPICDAFFSKKESQGNRQRKAKKTGSQIFRVFPCISWVPESHWTPARPRQEGLTALQLAQSRGHARSPERCYEPTPWKVSQVVGTGTGGYGTKTAQGHS